MEIKEITIQNWRSIKNITIDFQSIMIFIGQNNHGKSNIISAILFFFGEISPDCLDFNNGADNLYVEITFHNLDEYDNSTFKKYITSDNTIKVRKVALKSGGFEYHGYKEIPDDDWLKEENISNYTKREEAEKLPLKDYLPDAGRITKDLFQKAQTEYIKANRSAVTFNYQLETTNFLGLKNVAKGIFGEVYYIPSVKNASDELNVKGSSAFAKLYSHVINKMSETNDEYKEAKTKIESLIKILNKTTDSGENNPKRPAELGTLEKRLDQELSNWATKVDVEITPPNIDDIFRLGASVWVDDGIRTDISRKGHGLQRAIIFALIKSWAKFLEEENSKKTEEESEDDTKKIARQTSNSTYFFLEEPELYLHPQAQRELYSSLVELSNSQNQVMLCTHSASFIDLNHYKSICIIKKRDLTEGTTKYQCQDDLFTMEEERKNFNLVYWTNPDRSELFFAKKVLLVEGPTDKTVIPYLAKNLNVFRYDYTLIDCAGKDVMPCYIHLLNKFSIPYVVVYDKDHQTYKGKDAIETANKATEIIEGLIESSIGSSVVLVNDIEEEIGITEKEDKHKPYYALKQIENPSFKITDLLKEKIERIYS